MSKVENAVSCFREGFLCSQALLSVFGPDLGLDRETALKVSAAFGGGMARLGETCGAVSGAVMVIGLKYGHFEARDEQAKEKTYRLAREFVAGFEAVHGSTVCRELLGCDISTPEGLRSAREQKLFSTVCPKYVQTAAEIIERM